MLCLIFHKDPCLCSSIEIRNYYKLLHQHLHRLIANLHDGNANTRWGTFFNKQEFIPIIRLFIIFRSTLRNVLGRIEINILTKTIIWDIARVLYLEIMEVRPEHCPYLQVVLYQRLALITVEKCRRGF